MEFIAVCLLIFISFEINKILKSIKIMLAIQLALIPEDKEELARKNLEIVFGKRFSVDKS